MHANHCVCFHLSFVFIIKISYHWGCVTLLTTFQIFYINVTHHRHFTSLYLFGNNQNTVDMGMDQEPSIYTFHQCHSGDVVRKKTKLIYCVIGVKRVCRAQGHYFREPHQSSLKTINNLSFLGNYSLIKFQAELSGPTSAATVQLTQSKSKMQ